MRRLLILCLLLPTLAAAASVEVLPLHNRPAEEIIPLLQPLLGPEDAISGQGGTLIVRSSPATLQTIQRLLGELDRAPRNLLISVRSSMDDLREGTSAGGRIQAGPGGTTIQGSAGARELSTGRGATQQIRVLEGMPAMLRVGEETSRTEPVVVPYPGGYAVVPATTTRATGRWLRVVPRLQGQQVLLAIEPEEAHPDPHQPRTLDVQRLATEVVVPLGQWVPLGGLESQEARSSGWSASTRSQSSEVWVKVELAEGSP
ncbi:secretin N-terminal domain-containing protein [Thiofaba sp. EF100]|uniref:secretin N-terminal domain-containing protein n=1 Tax=Thiofaba sp. EF100 TaxID=3121274 RepID=UPI0032216D5C